MARLGGYHAVVYARGAMERYQYRVIPSPARAGKAKGAKTPSARAAASVEQLLNQQAEAGWSFLRAETLPFDERQGLTGSRTVFQTLLIFRRPADIDEDMATREALRLLEDRSEADQARPGDR